MNDHSTKVCNKCSTRKSLSSFGKLPYSKDGHKYRCDDCINEFVSARRSEQRIAKYSTRRYREHPEKFAEVRLRRRARKLSNGVFYIKPKFLLRLYSSPCIACGSDDNITADHVVPLFAGGHHSEGNLQPLCLSCNSSKGTDYMITFKIRRSDLFPVRIDPVSK